MRRSAAPSQLASASKRPRFTPPFANKQTSFPISAADTSRDQRSSVPVLNKRSYLDKSNGNCSALHVLQLPEQKTKPNERQFEHTVVGDQSKHGTLKAGISAAGVTDKYPAVKENSNTSTVVRDSPDSRNAICQHNETRPYEMLKESCKNPPPSAQQTQSHGGSKLQMGNLKCTNSTEETIKAIHDNASSTEQTLAPSVGLKPRGNIIQHRGFRQPLLHTSHPRRAPPVEDTVEAVPNYFNVVWYVYLSNNILPQSHLLLWRLVQPDHLPNVASFMYA